MFYFVDFDNPSKSASVDKGKLFEELCTKLVSYYGYKDIKLRVKRNNLEYDIEAVSKVSGKKLVGEAKAWQNKISDEILTFIAKMLPYWSDDPDTFGLFISLSEITPDVKGTVDKIIASGKNFRYIVSDEIINLLCSEESFPSFEQIKNKIKNFNNYNPGETYFLVSDRGYFYVQLLIPSIKSRPDSFCIFNQYGDLLDDEDFANLVKKNIDVLQELKVYVKDSYPIIDNQVSEYDNPSFLKVISGNGWFDYFNPAPPDKFIGRSIIISKFLKLIEDTRLENDNSRICQILSRSGVGKSSIALKLGSMLDSRNDAAIVIDSRNIRSEIDILNVFQLLIKHINDLFNTIFPIPANRKDIYSIMREVNTYLITNKKLAIVFLDQFESIFLKPKLYNLLLDYIFEFYSYRYNLVFCIARKNDQPTTYDDSVEIDLNRLNSISIPLPLDDFELPEAEELIDKMTSELGRPLIKSLKEQVLEISNYFPWLLKKFCAHIIKLVKNGKTQTQIMNEGMQLEDLFNEDINALDEPLKEFFKRLVYYLPATQTELSDCLKILF